MSKDNDNKVDAPEGERIAKVMARAGLCSRRDAEAWIADGRVSLNGKKLTSPAVNVQPHDVVKVDGKLLPEAEKTRLFRYHKPRGLVTTAKDPEGRPTVFDSLPDTLPRVISVGRLDLNSEGLLLLTNDGELARRLELPATGWVRRYRVRVNGRIDPATLTKLAKGIEIEGVRYGAIEAALDRQQGDNAWLTMALTEGKNREIRKVCAFFGWTVSRLIRLSYGPFQLGYLEKGEIEEVPGKVLRDQLGQPGGAEPLRPQEAGGGKARPPKQRVQRNRTATPRDENDDRVFRKHKPDEREQRRGRSDQRPSRDHTTSRDHAAPRDQRVKERAAADQDVQARRNLSPQELAASLRSALDRASREDRAEELQQQRQGRPTGGRPTGDRPTGDRPTGDRPTAGRPAAGKPHGDKRAKAEQPGRRDAALQGARSEERRSQGKRGQERPDQDRSGTDRPDRDRPRQDRPRQDRPGKDQRGKESRDREGRSSEGRRREGRGHEDRVQEKHAPEKRSSEKRSGGNQSGENRSGEKRSQEKRAAGSRTEVSRSPENRTREKPGKLTLNRAQGGKSRSESGSIPERRPSRNTGPARAGGPSKGKNAHRQRRP